MHIICHNYICVHISFLHGGCESAAVRAAQCFHSLVQGLRRVVRDWRQLGEHPPLSHHGRLSVTWPSLQTSTVSLKIGGKAFWNRVIVHHHTPDEILNTNGWLYSIMFLFYIFFFFVANLFCSFLLTTGFILSIMPLCFLTNAVSSTLFLDENSNQIIHYCYYGNTPCVWKPNESFFFFFIFFF